MRPAFPLFLGRRACPPTLPLVLGIRNLPLEIALDREPWQGHIGKQPKKLRVRVETPRGEVAPARVRDLPVSFDPRQRHFAFRGVSETYSRFSEETTHDAMSELEEGDEPCI